MTIPHRTSLLPLVLMCATAVPVLAQDLTPPDTQPVSVGVDLATLNVRLEIPLVSKSGLIPFSKNLVFDNNFWKIGGRDGAHWRAVGANTVFGWRNEGNVSQYTHPFGGWRYVPCKYSSVDGTIPNQIAYIDGDNQYHLFTTSTGSPLYIGSGSTNYSCGTNYPSATGYTVDGSGLTAPLSTTMSGVALVTKDGTHIIPDNYPSDTELMTDANGNTISATSRIYNDSLGVQELTLSNPMSNAYPLPFSTYTYPTSTGNASINVNFVSYSIQIPAWGCGGDFTSTTAYLVDNIVLGDGTSTYRFTYESVAANTVTGRLGSVTYPDGKVVSYSYGTGLACSNTSLTGDFTDYGPLYLAVTDASGTTTYTRPTTGLATTVVGPAPASNKTVYTFSKQAGGDNLLFLTQKQVYQGASTLLKTEVTCYQGTGTFSTCPTAAAPTYPITQTDTYTLLAGMSNSSRQTSKSDNYGNVKESDAYDFGASTPYQKIVASNFGYTWNGSTTSPSCSSLIGNGIMDKPCQKQLQTGSGAQVKNSYAQYSSTGHLIKTGELVSGTTNYITMSASYNTNGTLASMTDANGNPTTITNGACNNGFLTVMTPPPPFSALAARASWDCNIGKTTSVTDPNGFAISTDYNDPLLRPTAITDQAGAVTNISYLAPGAQESILTFNGGNSTIDVFSKDFPLLNSSEVQQKESPSSSNWDTDAVDFVWDSTGVKNETSPPCVATSQGGSCTTFPPGVKSTVTHDALGRPLVKTDGGGGTITYSYIMGASQYDVLAELGPAPAGEVTKKVQKEYNGLGQLLSVCKLGASGGVSCGQVGGGTGELTTFTYNADGTLPKAVRVSQTHSYTYDNLGRTLTSTTPEGGTKQFFFDSAPDTPGSPCGNPPNDIGRLAKTFDANGTTTCFYYDSIGRITGLGYAGPNSDTANCKNFAWDSATVNGVVMTDTLGRIAEAYTVPCSGGSNVTDEGFSYDARGNLSDVYQWSTHSGGWFHTSAMYFDNGAIQTLSGMPGGQSPWTFDLDGKGRPRTSSTPTATLLTGATYNAADQPLTITLGLGDKDTYNWDSNTGRMTQYDFSIGATPKHFTGTPSWNTNGTLLGLTVVDGVNAGADSEVCDYGTSSNAGYDAIGRLVRVNCMNGSMPVWGQNFAYDVYDNVTKTVPTGQTGITWAPGYSAANNHYQNGSTYDSNGNLLTDTFHTYTWNQDNRPKSIDTTTMIYDAFGRMVEGHNGSYFEKLQSPMGEIAIMAGVSTTTQWRIPLPGGGTAVTGVEFEHADMLGTAPFVSYRGARSFVSSRLFAPYGESYNNTGNTGYLDFTGDRQDLVAGTYDTPNRELNPNQGRWLSPDPAGASWNAYQYSTNPMVEVDPSGLDSIYVDGFLVGAGWAVGKNHLPYSGMADNDQCVSLMACSNNPAGTAYFMNQMLAQLDRMAAADTPGGMVDGLIIGGGPADNRVVPFDSIGEMHRAESDNPNGEAKELAMFGVNTMVGAATGELLEGFYIGFRIGLSKAPAFVKDAQMVALTSGGWTFENAKAGFSVTYQEFSVPEKDLAGLKSLVTSDGTASSDAGVPLYTKYFKTNGGLGQWRLSNHGGELRYSSAYVQRLDGTVIKEFNDQMGMTMMHANFSDFTFRFNY